MTKATLTYASSLPGGPFTDRSGVRKLTTADSRNAIFGYPETVTAAMADRMYRRNPVAKRVVEVFPSGTWSEAPKVELDGKEYDIDSEVSSEVFPQLKLLDKLTARGEYGIAVLGVDDGRALTEPVGVGKPTYIRPYSGLEARVTKFNTDPSSSNFNAPEMYTVQPKVYGPSSGRLGSFQVHHSRVLHVAELVESDPYFGTLQLEPSFNFLLDLEKLIGAMSEGFYNAADRGILFSLKDSDGELPTEEDLKQFDIALDEYFKRQRRSMVTDKFEATPLGSDTPDASIQVTSLVALIAGTHGVPQRILLGTERGELSSTQDAAALQSRINTRRVDYASPRIVLPYMRFLQRIGYMPPGQVSASWNESDGLGPVDRANVNKTVADTAVAIAGSFGVDDLLTRTEKRSLLGLEPMRQDLDSEIQELTDLPELPE